MNTMKTRRLMTILTGVFLLALVLVLSMIPKPYAAYVTMIQPALLIVLCAVIFMNTWIALLIGILTPVCLYFIFWNGPFVPDYLMLLLVLTVTALAAWLIYECLGAVFPAVLIGVLSGRIVLGIAELIYHYVNDLPYSIHDYLQEGFVNGWPGLLAAVVLIPLIHYLIFHKEEERVK